MYQNLVLKAKHIDFCLKPFNLMPFILVQCFYWSAFKKSPPYTLVNTYLETQFSGD